MPVARGGSAESSKPLSVCLVSRTSSYANGGTAAYIRSLGEALKSRGNSVSAVARFFQKEPPVTRYEAVETSTAAEREAVAQASGVNIPLHLIAPSNVASPALRRLSSLLSRPITQSLGIALFDRAYGAALDAAIPADADVIHYTGNGYEMVGFSALAAARRRDIPFTVTPFVHPGAWGDGPLDIRFYNQADAVFVCSSSESEHLTARGVRPELLRRTGLGPASPQRGDGARFRAENALQNRPLILFLGRKERYKGYHALCAAMEIIQRDVSDVCLVAIGPDTEPPFPAVPPGALLNLGLVPLNDPAKPDALAACDILCMPSEAESFGIVYVEAWANGKPVIGGPAPAVHELIEEGITGYCVTQEPTEIADAAIRLLRDPALRERMGAAGLALQQSRYSWERVAADHEQVFCQASKSGAARQ